MFSASIANPKILKVEDEKTRKTHYGCDQDWYASPWQRLSGCGPAVAHNIVTYLEHKRKAFVPGAKPRSKQDTLPLMQQAWDYVTPTKNGLPKIKRFHDAVVVFAKARGLDLEYGTLEVPKSRSRRTSLGRLIGFLKGALLTDAPVAFLNLCNGAVKNLEAWHWVTIVSIRCAEDDSRAAVTIMDNGLIKRIDLSLWYATTTLGGGFVWFNTADAVLRSTATR